MPDNTVTVDRSVTPHRLVFSPRFNVAVPFIDRHVAEGRGDKVAIRTADEAVTYADLLRRVNRFGNALLSLGVRPGERFLMVVKDSPDFIALFFGAIKAGIVPVAVNTLLQARAAHSESSIRNV
jgi:acyl-coenzyme A synthetase/AMP-(fatty) acid ligase